MDLQASMPILYLHHMDKKIYGSRNDGLLHPVAQIMFDYLFILINSCHLGSRE